MEEAHLNVYQLSKRWGLSPGTLDHWRRYGKGPRFLKIGGHVLYRLCDITAYEEQQVRQTTVKHSGVPLNAEDARAA
jgi:transposase-like protein